MRVFLAVLSSALGAAASAQCVPGWLPGGELPGTDGDVWTVKSWDPDGAGPLPTCLVVGGLFNVAGGAVATNIAMWNPQTGAWSSLGAGLNGQVNALAVLSTGELVAGGMFTQAGAVAVSRIAKWNGSVWQPLGAGVDNQVRGLYVMPNGDLIAGGSFTHAGGNSAFRIARWNGASWSAMGSGFGNDVIALMVWKGDLIAGGVFTSPSHIARWTGTIWTDLGLGTSSAVNSLGLMPNGDLAVGGIFGFAGGTPINGVASWNGTAWSQIGPGVGNHQVTHIINDANGDLVVSGYFSINGSGVARWNGSTWTGIGKAPSGATKQMVLFPDGKFYIGGTFDTAESKPAFRAARLDAGAWTALSPSTGPVGSVVALGLLNSGKVIASGNFESVAGLANTRFFALWNGSGWESLTAGTNNGSAVSMDTMLNGDIVAGGDFTTIGGVSANRIARWNGTVWSPLGTGLGTSGAYVVRVLSNGDVIAGGPFVSAGGVGGTRHLARWNGSAWLPIGASSLNGSFDSVVAVAEMPNGDLIVGGNFSTIGGVSSPNIGRWNGSSWSAIGSGLSGNGSVVACILPLSATEFLAGGTFNASGATVLNNLARWNGSAWVDMTQGLGTSPGVQTMVRTPAGDIIMSGYFAIGSDPARGSLARWTGSQWTKFAGGLGGFSNYADQLAIAPSRQLLVAGHFTIADKSPSAYFARYNLGLPLEITSQPLDVALLPGQTATFDVGATADSSNIYQWRKNDQPLANGGRISGADTPTLQISNVQDEDQACYSCFITGDCGSATSHAALLSCAPLITQQPPQSLALKRSKQLALQVPAAAPYTYQWRRDSVNLTNIPGVLAGATTRTLTFLSPDLSLWGVYDCVLTDVCGNITTAATHVCLGDLNNDGLVDDADFILFAQAYNTLLCSDGSMPAGCPSDFNNDTVVDDADFSYFVQGYDILLCP